MTPELLPTSPDVAEDVQLAENVSIAILSVPETLTPTQRAVFALREVFDMPYGEIAQAMDNRRTQCDRSPSRAREQGHRAQATGAGGSPPCGCWRRTAPRAKSPFLSHRSIPDPRRVAQSLRQLRTTSPGRARSLLPAHRIPAVVAPSPQGRAGTRRL